MSTTIGSRTRLEAGVSLLAAALVAWLAASTTGGTTEDVLGATTHSVGVDLAAPPASASSVSAARGSARVALIVGGGAIATATLADTSAARNLAAMLPVTIETEQRFGQAMVGRLPGELMQGDGARVSDPAAGHLYYWPPDGTFAVLTADLGPSVPAPGLVPLGVVDSGLDALAAAGNRFDMTIDTPGMTQQPRATGEGDTEGPTPRAGPSANS